MDENEVPVDADADIDRNSQSRRGVGIVVLLYSIYNVFFINKRIFFRPSYGKCFPGPSGRPSRPPEIPKRKSYHPIREVTMEVNLLDEIHKLNDIAPKVPVRMPNKNYRSFK